MVLTVFTSTTDRGIANMQTTAPQPGQKELCLSIHWNPTPMELTPQIIRSRRTVRVAMFKIRLSCQPFQELLLETFLYQVFGTI